MIKIDIYIYILINPKCPLPITNKALILFFFMVSSHVFQQITLTNEANDIPKVFKGL